MSTTEAAPKAVSAAGWKRAAVHTIRCPSGVFADIKIPDLPTLIEAGDIPQNLLDAALQYAGGKAAPEQPTKESIIRDREFRDTLVSLTVVEPKLTPADVSALPTEDKDFLTEIALRTRDVDAEGEHIGGLSTSEKFRKFRGLDSLDSVLEGA